jgi:hypothetical protein
MISNMHEYLKNYLDFIESLKTDYSNSSEALKKEDRKDEAILYKVRTNICDIFTTLVGSTVKKVASMKLTADDLQTKAFNIEYMKLFEQIPANWVTNLEKAKKFNDPIAAKTEEVKLDTVNILKSKFIELASLQTKFN